ncbi:1-aminocyclopropane-1-carboxylate deaminase/D-cysteine desulfhydrase [Mesoflavibacter sp. SCSIO 43206]|uniref:1-aminocyclopropane-1-carboxylate deaminase/D-cysteine desulfhydrase n=1 Tax=Mesoflavibacter sp. SCSIO 43206 TaxID=2779362 RepID=UPI001CA88B4B|nr:pyridoxal-phosphate dependent enzyme [Mesoflavibacter sp. SCSIO 43206]UAB75931.1 1-aminocyclopropane-1-carboxylate deaminase/D-cysteine desulfhydrase [Mesoflavibacter sp. SCSIO 43206]
MSLNLFSSNFLSDNQHVWLDDKKDIELSIKREDLIHPFVSGNKYRKLKYNVLQARKENKTTLLTFGGAFSNHIAAVASAGKAEGFNTIGFIRGEELKDKVNTNPTLSFAKSCGMTLKFISRKDYRDKSNPNFISNLKDRFGDFYLIPEGGTNNLAIKGCQEILNEKDSKFDYICCAVGTGGTVSGIINASKSNQKVLGFSSLKGDFLNKDISKFARSTNWELITDYHFGGYGKINDSLITFINKFKAETEIPLDPIYTGKMMFGIFDLIQKGYFKANSKILAIHTGGLQGIEGMNAKLEKQNKPLII